MSTPKRSWLDTFGLLAVIAFVVGPILGWLRLIPALAAFYLFGLGGLVALITGLSALVQSARGRGFGAGRALALVAAMLFVFTATSGIGSPAINDFTTNLDDPPSFRRVASLPENSGRDLSYPASFAEIQRGCCADLATARLSIAPPQAFALALGAALAMPRWEVLGSDASTGEIEAVATSRLFGFRDYIAIRIRPSGAESAIDVRSKSRDGRGDMGANADRIRRYLSQLQEASRAAAS